jgi:MoaA/NifB/PqqE/SkfB family radical SAM enzyme
MTHELKVSVINLLTTTACNAWDLPDVEGSPGVCWFCYRETRGIRSTDQRLRAAMDKAVEHFGAERFTMTGGEPTMSPWFGPAVRHAKQLGQEVHVHTNGVHFDTVYPEHGEFVDQWVLSVDGPDADTADWERGQGYFDQFARNMDTLRQDGKVVGIHSFVSPRNFRRLDDLAQMVHDYADRQRVDYWLASQYRDINRGSKDKREYYVFSPSEFAARLRGIEERFTRFILFLQPGDFVAAEERIEQTPGRVLLFAQPTRPDDDEYPFHLWLGADGGITVDPGGQGGRNTYVGNLIDDPFDQLLTNILEKSSSKRVALTRPLPLGPKQS